jgi:hypothetical protein
MGWVTDEQIDRAKEVDVLDYILKTEPDNIKRVGREYRLKDHPSLAVSPGKWYWHSHKMGGRTAVGYLTDVRGYSFVDAVCAVLNERPQERFIPTKAKPLSERKLFMLPLRNSNNRRIIAYLQSRGIDKELILNCIKHGDLYESKTYHNGVFIGRDERQKARYAALRGTTDHYKCDVEGSNKDYGFMLPPNDPNSREVAVFEAPVDALSHQTACKQGFIPPFDGWRLSLGGTSSLALEQFLKQHTQVKHCLICTDADEAGNLAAEAIAKIPGITAARSPPASGKDWNDTLMDLQKAQRVGTQKNLNERSW